MKTLLSHHSHCAMSHFSDHTKLLRCNSVDVKLVMYALYALKNICIKHIQIVSVNANLNQFWLHFILQCTQLTK